MYDRESATGPFGGVPASGKLDAVELLIARSSDPDSSPPRPSPSTAEVRAWARAKGLSVTDRGRLRPEIHQAWEEAHR